MNPDYTYTETCTCTDESECACWLILDLMKFSTPPNLTQVDYSFYRNPEKTEFYASMLYYYHDDSPNHHEKKLTEDEIKLIFDEVNMRGSESGLILSLEEETMYRNLIRETLHWDYNCASDLTASYDRISKLFNKIGPNTFLEIFIKEALNWLRQTLNKSLSQLPIEWGLIIQYIDPEDWSVLKLVSPNKFGDLGKLVEKLEQINRNLGYLNRITFNRFDDKGYPDSRIDRILERQFAKYHVWINGSVINNFGQILDMLLKHCLDH